MQKTPIEKAVELMGGNPYGRQALLARHLGLHRQQVQRMLATNSVPEKHCETIAALVDHKVTADELRSGVLVTPKKRKAA